MGHIQGITVLLSVDKQAGKDSFGSPIYEQTQIPIDNVLVAPATTDDITTSTDLYGKKAVYTLGIPKGDSHNWENTEVVFFNQRFKTFGKPLEGIEELIPLEWNKKVMVETYE